MASPLLIKIPFSAPIPEPTINAVGVARPKAQGQEITKTAVVASIARVIWGKSIFIHGKLKKLAIDI